MTAWARHEFALDRKGEGGGTEREALQDLLKRARTPERRAEIEAQLRGPEPPEGVEYLIEWFHELGPCLSSGFGPVPLTYAEIAAWSALRRIALAPWEVQAIRALSETFCEVNSGT